VVPKSLILTRAAADVNLNWLFRSMDHAVLIALTKALASTPTMNDKEIVREHALDDV
jgi:hypothetical protein